MPVVQGTVLTCTNPGCGCRLQVQVPCPHGEDYTCACGHALGPAGDTDTIAPTPGA